MKMKMGALIWKEGETDRENRIALLSQLARERMPSNRETLVEDASAAYVAAVVLSALTVCPGQHRHFSLLWPCAVTLWPR